MCSRLHAVRFGREPARHCLSRGLLQKVPRLTNRLGLTAKNPPVLLKDAFKTEADHGWSGELDLARFRMESCIWWGMLRGHEDNFCLGPLHLQALREGTLTSINKIRKFTFSTPKDKNTRVHHMFFYETDAETWKCLWDVCSGQPESIRQRFGQDTDRQLVCRPRLANQNAT